MSLPIKINLPPKFLDSEVRSGYEVSAKLKKIWAVELDLANEFMRVANKYNLRPIMFGGTLIGAVRHKGFIPWDDDLDFWMLRDDFEKLLSVAEDEFKHPYFLQHALNDKKYLLPYARLRNSQTTGAIRGNESIDYNNGIYIDIYVLDGYPDSMIVHRMQSLLIRMAALPCTLYFQEEASDWSMARKLVRVFRPIVRMVRYEFWYSLYVKSLKIFNDKAKIVGGRFGVSQDSYKYNYCRTLFDEIIYLPFENIMLPAPVCYDDLLCSIYGEYMKFPPESERGKWHEGIIHFEPEISYKEYLRGK